MERAVGCGAGALAEMSTRLVAILAGDTGAISALRILHLYMERLGCDFQVLPFAPFCMLWQGTPDLHEWPVQMISITERPRDAGCAPLPLTRVRAPQWHSAAGSAQVPVHSMWYL